MAIQKADYTRIAQELTTSANRHGSPVKGKCGRCFETVVIVSKADNPDAIAEKLFNHKVNCPRVCIIIN